MDIGVPREIKEQENRVGLVPSGVAQLVRRGHRVFVEKGAGVGADYADAEYREAGAELVDGHEAVFEAARMIVKVTSAPTPASCVW